MDLRWKHFTDHKGQPQTFSNRKAGYVYALCLVISVVTIIIAVHVTSLERKDRIDFAKRLTFDTSVSASFSNSTNKNSTHTVRVLSQKVEVLQLKHLADKFQNDELKLHLKPSDRPAHREQTTGFLNISATWNNPFCSMSHNVSELFQMKPFRFLPNYTNPCWYEPLVLTGIYEHNAFSKYLDPIFLWMKEEYRKKLRAFPSAKRLRCLPYFFIAGMPKCGSTDLFSKLVQHPDIAKPLTKEPHWWSRKRFGERVDWPASFRDYIDVFDYVATVIEDKTDAEGLHHLITGDSSVSTLWSNDWWYRLPENCDNPQEPKFTNAHYIRYHIPRARIIVILRDPTERLYSGYLYFQKSGKSPDLFHEEVVTAIEELEDCLNDKSIRACVYNRTLASVSKVRLRVGLYYVYIQEWLRVFPRDQIFAIRLEDYSQDPLGTLNTVYDFLGLQPLSTEETQPLFLNDVKNARRQNDKTVGDMKEDTRKLLNRFYHPYNQKLSELLHDQKYLWSDT